MLPGDYVGPVTTQGPDGETCIVWSQAREPWTPASWEIVNCDLVQSGVYFCVPSLRAMVHDAALVLQGSMNAVAATLARISRVVEAMSVQPAERRHILGRCVVRVVNGYPADIVVERLPARFWPGIYARMMRGSFTYPTYVPAHLVWSLYAGVFGKFEIAAGEWLQSRFCDVSVNHVEPLFGFSLEILPRVFVPDPVVLDLLLSAYVSPDSPLPADLHGNAVLEPCTGSGVLALALSRLGAANVGSSDIDEPSVVCVRRNVDRAALTDRISAHVVNGLPPDNGERVLLANPPWFPHAGDDMPDYCRRCTVDPERRLLAQLLQDAAARAVCVAYIFLGKANPFRRSALRNLFAAWRAEREWRSHGLRLHRLLLQ